MLRSLIAIVAAVLIGLVLTRLVEAAALMAFPVPDVVAGDATRELLAQHATMGYKAGLLVAWVMGAMAASAIAVTIGKRWAPLGIIATASIALLAAVTLLEFGLSWWLWPAALVATVSGGFASLRLFKARMQAPFARRTDGGAFGL